jgi:hypothetical protein
MNSVLQTLKSEQHTVHPPSDISPEFAPMIVTIDLACGDGDPYLPIFPSTQRRSRFRVHTAAAAQQDAAYAWWVEEEAATWACMPGMWLRVAWIFTCECMARIRAAAADRSRRPALKIHLVSLERRGPGSQEDLAAAAALPWIADMWVAS